MSNLLELSQNAWLDESDNTVVIAVDRTSITLDIDEFWEFCEQINNAKDKIISHENFTVGSYIAEDGTLKQQIILVPDKDDFN